MTMVVSTFDEDVEIWQNPEDKYQVYTTGDLFNLFGLEEIVNSFLAEIQDGKTPDLEKLFEDCEALGISPNPCPMCGRYGEHSHSMD